MQTRGQFVISLDFELMWGMFDKVSHTDYGAHLDGVHTVIPKLLNLFTQYNIHATWATVGLLAAANNDELEQFITLVCKQPQYHNPSLSAYEHCRKHDLNDYPEHYFAPHLIEQIIATPHQELASHTFSHFYCLEPQVDDETAVRESFAADCQAMLTIAKRYQTSLTSLVFPRNQWSDVALEITAAHGITCYRGTEAHPIYQARNESAKTKLWLRGLRFLDRYIYLTGHHDTHPTITAGLINIPASRQLHPYTSHLSWLEPLKLRRIKTGMTAAAKNGTVFHLWWHPHNFGVHQEKNLQLLFEVLQHYNHLKVEYGMESRTMSEVATQFAESIEPTTSAAAHEETPVQH